MRRLAIVLLLVVVAAATYRSFGSAETATGSLTLPGPAPDTGDPAPQFAAETMEGGRFVLSGEGLYVLTFWSTLNEGSDRARPDFSRLAQEYSRDGEDGISFAVVYVNSAPRDKNVPFIRLQDSSGRLASLYNVKRVPRTFVIEDGEIVLVQNGYYEENKKDLAQALDDSLQGP